MRDPVQGNHMMLRWWRVLLAIVLIAVMPLTGYSANADTQFSGIFDAGLDFGIELEDDFDEILRHLMPRVTADAGALDVPAPRPLRLFVGLTGPGPTSWPGSTPAGRAPPAGHTRYQSCPRSIEPPPCVASGSRFQPGTEQYSPPPSGPAASAPPTPLLEGLPTRIASVEPVSLLSPAPRLRLVLPVASTAPGSSTCALASMDKLDHRLPREGDSKWPS